MVLNFQEKNRIHVLDMMTISFYLSVVKYDVSVRSCMAANRLFAAISFSQSSTLMLWVLLLAGAATK